MPIAVGVYRWQRCERALKLLLITLVVGFVTDCCTIWKQLDSYSLHLIAHFYVLIEFIAVMLIIYLWQESLHMKKIIKIASIIYITFWIFAKFTFESFDRMYSLTSSVSVVILILSAGYTLFIVLENKVQRLSHNNRFWIILSFILVFSGTLMPGAVQEILFTQSRQSLFIAWYVTWASTIIANILFTVGFLCPQKQT